MAYGLQQGQEDASENHEVFLISSREELIARLLDVDVSISSRRTPSRLHKD